MAEGDRPKPGGGEAVVVFITKLPQSFQVPEDELVVPGSLGRYGLSEVVNRLLSLERPVPFDFLVEGEFLRTSIAQYLEARKLSSEKVLQLEYVLALSEPEQEQVDETPDWISGLVALQVLPTPWFASVSFDGTARVYEGSTARLTVKLADAGLAGVASLPIDGGRGSNLVAAGQDGSVICCALQLGTSSSGTAKGSKSASAGAAASLRAAGRPRAVQAVALNDDGTLLGSAGWDHEVLIWNAEPELFASAPAAGAKRKAPAGEGQLPKFSLKGHSQVVTSLYFGPLARFPFTLLSGSWDCSVRVWDIVAASCVSNWSVARAVTSFSISPMSPQMATSHEDGHVSLWDIRATPHPSRSGALSLDASSGLPLGSAQAPHRRLAAQVAWCPQDNNRIASVGHDGHLCILDPRSPKMPVQSVRVGATGPIPTKLLCCAWLSRDSLVVGGSDGKVVRIGLTTATPAIDADS